jgi:hypothetical protein
MRLSRRRSARLDWSRMSTNGTSELRPLTGPSDGKGRSPVSPLARTGCRCGRIRSCIGVRFLPIPEIDDRAAIVADARW